MTAFVGTLHQVSLWDVPATADHMWNAAHNCTWPIAGSVRAWSSFLPGIKGEVEKRFMTQCKALDMCTTNCSHFLHCESRQARYHCVCQAGFSGPHCDINIDDCGSNPCVNGQCMDGVNRYDCKCNNGYYGTNCEKKIIDEKECPILKEPRNGKTRCRKLSGKMLCIMSCVEGHAFSAKATTMYGCGPDTDWKWNGKDYLWIPSCASKAAPKEIEHHFSIKFPGIQCSNIKTQDELRSAIKNEVNETLSTIPGCHACQLKKVTVPGCELFENQRKRRAVSDAMEVLFSLVVKKATDSSSVNDNVEEKSEAVLFQMQYAVATGQFEINLHGMSSTAERSSLKHISSNVICGIGYVTSGDRKACVACPVGTYYSYSFNCELCYKGSYQDKEGQTGCKSCGRGKSTDTFGAISSEDCIKDNLPAWASMPHYAASGNTVVYIVVIAVAIAVAAIVYVFASIRSHARSLRLPIFRFRKRRTDEEPVGFNNPAFGADAEQLEERPTPVYPINSEIPDQSTHSYENSNAAGGSSNTDCIQLKVIKSDPDCEQLLPNIPGRTPLYDNAGYQSEETGKEVEQLFSNKSDGTPKYVTTVEGKFTSTGGVLSAPQNSDIKIEINRDTFPPGKKPTIFFRVIFDETALLRYIPKGPDETLISPVIECGPHDINLLKPVTIIVPHCLYMSKAEKKWVTVFRSEQSTDQCKGRVSWEKVPNKSEKTDQCKAWFTVKEDAIHIETKTFSIWSIFSRSGCKKKVAAIFASKPHAQSNVICLRLRIYDDNQDSKKRVVEQENGLSPLEQKPFKMYNDKKAITVRLTNVKEGWELDFTPDVQTYSYENAYESGCRTIDTVVFAVKPKKDAIVEEFSGKIEFQQEDHVCETQWFYVNPDLQETAKQCLTQSGGSKKARSDANKVGEGSSSAEASQEGRTRQFHCSNRRNSSKSSEDSTSYSSSNPADDKQVTAEQCFLISSQVGNHRKDVLRRLSVDEATIENIEETYSEAREKFYQGLLAWSGKFGSEATTKKLCDALRHEGCWEAHKTLSEDISNSSDV